MYGCAIIDKAYLYTLILAKEVLLVEPKEQIFKLHIRKLCSPGSLTPLEASSKSLVSVHQQLF